MDCDRAVTGRIYFVGSADFTGPVKIGWTRDLDRRLSAIQCGNPVRLAVWASIPGELLEELSLHASFSESRTREDGEWYNQTQRLLWLLALCGCEAFPYPDVTEKAVFAAMLPFGHLPARRYGRPPRCRRQAHTEGMGGRG